MSRRRVCPLSAHLRRHRAVICEAREIAKCEAHVHAFAAALANNPRTPAPELPDVDPTPDESVVYSDRSASERAVIDRAFVPVTVRKSTVDSELIETQVREANAARNT